MSAATAEEAVIEYTRESKVIAISPKVPAFLSILGSSYIVYNILFVQRKKKDRRNRLYHQMMLGLSLSDIMASHIYFLGTFLIPRGSGGPFGPVFWAFGTDRTCSYSGFFNQFAVASPIYNTMLSLYFLLKIRYGWKEVELCKISYFLHGLPIAFACGTSLFALFRQPDTLYGNVFWTCWINPDPPQPDFRWFQWSFLFAPVWVCVFLQTVAMCFLYSSVRTVEKETQGPDTPATQEQHQQAIGGKKKTTMTNNVAMNDNNKHSTEDSYSSDDMMDDEDDEWEEDLNDVDQDGEEKAPGGDTEAPQDAAAILAAHAKKQQHSRTIAIQGILYVCAFYVSWFFPTLQRILELAHVPPIFVLQALDTTLLPLQGIFNVFIFLRPKYVFYKRKYPDLPAGSIMRIVHNRTNESSVVSKFTTRLNEKLQSESRNNHTMNPSRNTNNPRSHQSGMSQELQPLPTIDEGGSGRESSSKVNSRSNNNYMDDSSGRPDSSTYSAGGNAGGSVEPSSNNSPGGKSQDSSSSGRVAGVRMDGSFWRAGE